MSKLMITLSKGGKSERKAALESLPIPDLWNLALAMPEPHKTLILETWHLAHDLKRDCLEAKEALAKSKSAVENTNLPPSARLELVRDLATPVLA